MRRVLVVLWRIIKWTFLSVLALLFLLVVLVNIPAVHDYALAKGTEYFNEQTGGNLSVASIDLRLPYYIQLNGVSLDTPENKEMVYFQNLEVSLGWRYLLDKTIRIDKLVLSDARAAIRMDKDGANFDFIVDGFSDSTAVEPELEPSTNPWDFSIGNIRLSDVNLNYSDGVSGDSAAVDLGNLIVIMRHTSLNHNAYLAEKIQLQGSDIFYRLGETEESAPEKEPPSQPDSSGAMALGLDLLLLESNTIQLEMGLAPDSYFADIGKLVLETEKIDLEAQTFDVNKLELAKTSLKLKMAPSKPDTTTKPLDPFAPVRLDLSSLSIAGLDVLMETYGEAEPTVDLRQLRTEIKDIRVDSSSYALEIESLQGIYGKLDRLETLHAKLRLDRQSLDLSNLELAYGETRLNAAALLAYTSLDDLVTHGKFSKAELKIDQLSVAPDDVRHFGKAFDIPDSVMVIPDQRIRLEAYAKGDLEQLTIKHLQIETGNSSIKMSGTASGTEWIEKSYLLDSLHIHMERDDVLPYTASFGLDTSYIPPIADLFMKGKFDPTNTKMNARLRSTYGNVQVDGSGGGWQSKQLPIHLELNTDRFDLGSLLALDVPFVTDLDLRADVVDVLDTTSTLSASTVALIDRLQYDQYALRDIKLGATLDTNIYVYRLAIQDTFLVADLRGSGALEPDMHLYLKADLQGIDFQGLGITEEDIRGRIKMDAEYRGDSTMQAAKLNTYEAIFVKDERRYEIDPINADVYLSDDSSRALIQSEFFELNTFTNRTAEQLTNAIADLLGHGEKELTDTAAFWSLSFSSKDSPALRDLLLNDQGDFKPATASITFDAGRSSIDAKLNFPGIAYAGYEIDSLKMTAIGNADGVKSTLKIKHAGLDTLGIDNLLVHSETTPQGARIELMTKKDTVEANYYIGLNLVADSARLKNGFSLNLIDSLVLNNEVWNVDPANDIRSSDEGLVLKKLRIFKEQSELEFSKESDAYTTDLQARMFPLSALSGILGTDALLLTGDITGDLGLNSDGSFSGKGKIDKFQFAQTDFGKLSWEAEKQESRFYVDVSSKGEDIDFDLTGNLTPESKENSAMDISFNLVRLDIAALPKLAPDVFLEGEGLLSGKVDITGSTSTPILNGELGFSKATVALTANGSSYRIDNQKIKIEPERIAFNKFTVRDSAGQKLIVNGDLTHENYDKFKANMNIDAKGFELANVKSGKNEYFYGKLLADLDISISGRADAPTIGAKIDILDETKMSYIVPESEYSESFDEELLVWDDFDSKKSDPILTRDKEEAAVARDVYANTIDLNGELKIGKDAIFEVIIDSAAGDYLQIKGGGTLGITYDRTGSLRLNGTYKVQDGFYQLSFYNVVKKKFNFQGGSTMSWNGDPLGANMDITATYLTKANVSSLMAAEPGSSGNDAFQQKLPFEVVMNLKGELSKPEITFSIRLAKEAQGALGGSVDARLAQLQKDESELNKQVFALLVLNTFLNTGSSGSQNIVANQARNSASQILSQQLNALSDKLIAGVDLNFDLESYGGAAGEGNTDLNIDLAKSFANDRVIVRVGSTIALENNSSAAQNSNALMTNVALEYKITPDGRYRFKAYRKTDLEDIVVGRITRSGAGVLFQRDFDRWENLFDRTRPVATDSTATEDPDDENSKPESTDAE